MTRLNFDPTRPRQVSRSHPYTKKKTAKPADSSLYPSESQEQTALFNWAETACCKWPELRWMYHVPNGGTRNAIEAAHLQAQGVKPGVPDVVLPIARGGYFGLYIEMKKQVGGVVSEHQRDWLNGLQNLGYLAVVCTGFQAAANMIEKYMSLPATVSITPPVDIKNEVRHE